MSTCHFALQIRVFNLKGEKGFQAYTALFGKEIPKDPQKLDIVMSSQRHSAANEGQK